MQKIKLPQIKLPKFGFPKALPFIDKWKFGRRYVNIVLPLLCLGVVATIAIGASSPLLLQLYNYGQDIKVLDLKIKDYKDRLGQAKSLSKKDLEKAMALLSRKFSPNYSLSYVLNSLTELGKSLNIQVKSINPGSEMKIEQTVASLHYSLKVLPIGIDLESEYSNFGEFMDSLSHLPDCLIVIKGYTLTKDENILPRISAKLELEACIIEGKKENLDIEPVQEETVQEEGK
ncbi:MAG: type 4a pilus biogenesis protein PilO [Candidatus Omnitrophota bacterium]|nr:type 4a pilus biogenesis protein PilO [Candidatus Omnitrophota bacterium]